MELSFKRTVTASNLTATIKKVGSLSLGREHQCDTYSGQKGRKGLERKVMNGKTFGQPCKLGTTFPI